VRKIRFPLPRGGSGIPANLRANEISVAIVLWCAMNGFVYQDFKLEKIPELGVVLTLPDSLTLAQFKLSWNRPDLSYKQLD